jgi:hypothetical protein
VSLLLCVKKSKRQVLVQISNSQFQIPILHSQKRYINNHDVFLNVHKDEDTYIVFIHAPETGLKRIHATNDLKVAKRIQNALATRCGLACLKGFTTHELINENVFNEIVAKAVQDV